MIKKVYDSYWKTWVYELDDGKRTFEPPVEAKAEAPKEETQPKEEEILKELKEMRKEFNQKLENITESGKTSSVLAIYSLAIALMAFGVTLSSPIGVYVGFGVFILGMVYQVIVFFGDRHKKKKRKEN